MSDNIYQHIGQQMKMRRIVAKYLNTPVLNFIPAAEYTAVEQYTQEQLNESQQ